MQRLDPLSVAALASAKQLNVAVLRDTFHVADTTCKGRAGIRIPYFDAAGQWLFDKIRLPDGSARRDPSGGPFTLYGVERLADAPPTTLVVLVEGESDVWACAHHGVMAVGVPGAASWRSEFAAALSGRRLLLWEEPDEAGKKLVVDVARDLPDAWLITGSADVKDACDLHQQTGRSFHAALQAKYRRAVRVGARAEALRRTQEAARPRALPPRSIARRAAMYPQFESELERARSRPIDAVFAEFGVELKGRGTERVARCPFHKDGHERRPSLGVNLSKSVWRCRACGVGGDAIAFVQRLRGMDFHQAVRQVAS